MPLVIDLFCGLGGWSEGFLSEGYECVGYDIEAHDYGNGGYPCTLILRDVRSIHGSEFKDATCIVGSSPCQEFSYRAMPWSRAKALPPPYLGIELFNAQFRIQREASEAAGRHIPMVVENVRGAQKFVGRAQWHYGSFYLWGDVPALMPMTNTLKLKTIGPVDAKQSELYNCHINERRDGIKTVGIAHKGRNGHTHTRHLTNQRESDAVNLALYADRDSQGIKQQGSGHIWYRTGNGAMSSKSNSRKEASAMIAKIPFPLSQHIAQCFKGGS